MDDVHRLPTKKFWAYVKSMGTGNTGMTLLEENGRHVTALVDQAELLNRQFQSDGLLPLNRVLHKRASVQVPTQAQSALYLY